MGPPDYESATLTTWPRHLPRVSEDIDDVIISLYQDCLRVQTFNELW